MRIQLLRTAYLTLALTALSTLGAAGQTKPTWQREEKSDPLTDKHFSQFTLVGKFLTAPSGPHPTSPTLMVRCEPGRRSFGKLNGKFLEGYVVLGSVVDAATSPAVAGEVETRFRLDDGKVRHAYWGHSTNYSALTFSDVDFATLLYGHFMPHKANTSEPIHKVIVEAPEFLGSNVVVQFDMPDPTEVASACGELRVK